MKLFFYTFLLILFSWIRPLHSQSLVCKNIAPSASIFVDTMSLDPGSISIRSKNNTKIDFRFDINTNLIHLNDSLSSDSLLICYRTFPFQWKENVYHRNPSKINNSVFYSEYRKNSNLWEDKREELFKTQNLRKNGTISRGISFGNTQNVFVNSALNLQLEGQLTDDVKINALISDQNVPIQPDGNTQNIQQFDKIILNLEHNQGFKLSAGDLVWNTTNGTLLKYLKNVQGAMLRYDYKVKKVQSSSTIGIAVSKGKFSSLQFNGSSIPVNSAFNLTLQEGVLGPYRLIGANGERFIIVISNTEKLFLDGKLLRRGFDGDYIIDYNSAEITFSPGTLITKYSRLQVDFEYIERNYARTSTLFSHESKWKESKMYINYFKEADNPNNPININLRDKDRTHLQKIGDSLSLAFVSGVDSVGAGNGSVLYEQIDTLVNGILYSSIYLFSGNSTKSIYRVSFYDVGEGIGEYILVNNATNGRVYQWVGEKKGRYLPIKIIATPKKKEVYQIGLEHKLTKYAAVNSEFVVSNNDLNLYSTEDDIDNGGLATKLSYSNRGRRLIHSWRTAYTTGMEFYQANFTPIDRFREVDFDRNWGNSLPAVNNQENKLDDKSINYGIELYDSLFTKLGFKGVTRNKFPEVKGQQNEYYAQTGTRKLFCSGSYFTMDNNRLNKIDKWKKWKSTIRYRTKLFVPEYQFAQEEHSSLLNDSLTSSLQNFKENTFKISNKDSSKINYSVQYSLRNDKIPQKGSFVNQSNAEVWQTQAQIPLNKRGGLAFTGAYRKVKNDIVRNKTESALEENISSKVQFDYSFLEKIIRTDMIWTTSTGRELQREYIYLSVPNGQGNYFWNDDNKDGIQQLYEFYLAQFPDQRLYLKTLVPTDKYINAYATSWNGKIQVDMPTKWRNSTFWKQQLARLSILVGWQEEKRITASDIRIRVIPAQETSSSSDLLGKKTRFNSSIFLNKNSTKWGGEMSVLNTTSKQLLTNGFEEQAYQRNQLSTRTSISKIISLRNQSEINTKRTSSDFLVNRNFEIKGYKLRLETILQTSLNLRLTITTAYSEGSNKDTRSGIANSNNKEGGVEIRFAKKVISTLSSSIKLVDIQFRGTQNSPVGFELLESLQPGRNVLWTCNWQQRLGSGLQLTLTYEGRKSEVLPVIHTGKMQLSALF